MRFIDSKICG